ncbi:peptidase inhibitor family I36 protein [Phytomonospora endophytica]|uniref:Peptidase inhibitor family I36 n=1 Tax=Phytomonospora endophytica TaxID=714109 RepID=A0A841FL87_9ACTN|nr:peptidase inhibitor family I36 protein [Phytomonospora endophytica]MBB6036624.1 hypothetical protein [Phytomonospora endophytica]GIG65945.1 hypothetical protein Pen01_22400 [Phytomonospora endophytica]
MIALGRGARLGAVAAMALLGPVAVAAPAAAGPGCPPGAFCVWAEPNFTGKVYGGDAGGVCSDVSPGGVSMKNRMDHTVTAFGFTNCTGETFTLEPGFDAAHVPFQILGVLT